MNQIQSLESRVLFAGFSVDTNEYGTMTLTVNASAGQDRLELSQRTTIENGRQIVRLQLTHNGRYQSYTRVSEDLADRIVTTLVNTGGYKDRINIENLDTYDNGNTMPMLWVNAGGGNDQVFASGGFIVVEGGNGNDLLVGKTEFETAPYQKAFSLYAGPGDDTVIGSDESDAIGGGPGSDVLIGNDGDDYIQFGEDDDIVFAGNGDDYLVTGYQQSRSQIYGGEGFDTLAAWMPVDQGLNLEDAFSTLKITGIEERIVDQMG